jgi:hypothetical protein
MRVLAQVFSILFAAQKLGDRLLFTHMQEFLLGLITLVTTLLMNPYNENK